MMFFSLHTLSQFKYMNAFLHVAILDQGIMGFIYIVIMMVVSDIFKSQ